MDITKITQSNNINTTSNEKSKIDNNTSDFQNYMTKSITLEELLNMAADKYDVPRDLVKAIVKTESDFTTTAVSHCGATGLMQLMPKTAAYLGVTDSTDPVQNVMGGTKYISQLIDKYDGNYSLALAAYNGGPGNVAKYDGVPPFCEGYVEKVLSRMEEGVDVPLKMVTIDYTSNTSVVSKADAPSPTTPVSTTTSSIDEQSKSTESDTTNTFLSNQMLEAFNNYANYMKILNLLDTALVDNSKDDDK